ncbi:MAG: hypothetical protein JNL28_07920 [Planctomycetes bacterium]|nr:hypothetical protein [Planctomycetota bacterium]
MNDQTRAKLDGMQRLALFVGVAGLIGLVIGFTQNPHQFFQSYLFAFFIPLGFALGSLGMTMINYLTGGFWGLGARRIFQAGIRTIPFMVLLFLPLAYAMLTHPEAAAGGDGHGAGSWWLYPGTDHAFAEANRKVFSPEKELWLSGPFMVGRAAFYFLSWIITGFWILKNAKKYDETGDAKADGMTRLISGPGFLFFFLTMTFAAFDWAMSVQPLWFSTMYGVIFIVGQGLSTLAFAIIFLSRVKHLEPFKHFAKPNLFADLATLMFATVMLWAYTSFSQFLIIWSANLKEEAPWYVLRTSHGWQAIAIGLLVLHFALPFFLLLMRRIKKDASFVPFVAALLIVMRFVDVYWQVAPPFQPDGLSVHWLDFAAPVALTGIWVWYFIGRLKAHPLTSPRQELQLEAALGGAHH